METELLLQFKCSLRINEILHFVYRDGQWQQDEVYFNFTLIQLTFHCIITIWYEVAKHFNFIQKIFKKCESNKTDTTVMFYMVLKQKMILVFMATQIIYLINGF
jgi:hypothetical protein